MSIRSYFLPKLLSNRFQLLQKKEEEYINIITDDAKKQLQLQKLHRIWYFSWSTVPFYVQWKIKHKLPDQIQSLSDIKSFPPLTKNDLQEGEGLIFNGLKFDRLVSTGGSTGEPTRFPMSNTEFDEIYANMLLGRGWSGLQSFQKTALFWGHSHLFGTGFRGKMNQNVRLLKDAIMNIKRFNAYDMSIDQLKSQLLALYHSKPEVIIGYSSCLFKLAKFIIEQQVRSNINWNLKSIIATSETLTKSEAAIIEAAFHVPVIQEYGSAEAGVIAYTAPPKGHFKIFWDSFHCLADADHSLKITPLYDRSFPLINYQTDDIIKSNIDLRITNSVLEFESIEGRRQHILTVRTLEGDTLSLSGILIVHILKSYPKIYSVQTRQTSTSSITIDLVSSEPINLRAVGKFFEVEINKKHPKIDITAVNFLQISKANISIAGKEIITS